jgi:hypothetical protein
VCIKCRGLGLVAIIPSNIVSVGDLQDVGECSPRPGYAKEVEGDRGGLPLLSLVPSSLHGLRSPEYIPFCLVVFMVSLDIVLMLAPHADDVSDCLNRKRLFRGGSFPAFFFATTVAMISEGGIAFLATDNRSIFKRYNGIQKI